MRKDNEIVCVEYDKLNKKSMHVETPYDILVEQLKEQLCRVISLHQDEECLKVEEIRKDIDNEFALDIRN